MFQVSPQTLQNILNMRNQESAQMPVGGATMPAAQSPAPMQLKGAFGLGDVHDLSKAAGYDPKTLFGSPLAKLASAPTGQQGGALGSMQNMINSVMPNAMSSDPEANQAMTSLGMMGGQQGHSNMGAAGNSASKMDQKPPSSSGSGGSDEGGSDEADMGSL